MQIPQIEENTELFEHFNLIVDKGQTPLRLDKFLTARLENTSRARVQAAVESNCVTVNNKAAKSNYKIKPFDEISILMPSPKYELEILPENLPIDIIYEDSDVLVINKKAGMVVHPGHGNYNGTLVNALLFHLKDEPLFSTNEARPGIVHRIDKDTSGLLIVAKTEHALTYLAYQFFHHTITRKYVALVWGNLQEDSGTIVGNIGRNPKDRLQMKVFPDGSEGKHAVTHYRVIQRFNYVTLVECQLETGRTHQIRVHFQHLGHPLFNDERYGGDQILRGTNFSSYKQFVQNCFQIMPRQALHAQTIGFQHPTTHKTLNFTSDLPEDFQNLLQKWTRFSQNMQ